MARVRTAFLSLHLDRLGQLYGDDANVRRLLTLTRAGDHAAAEAVVLWLAHEHRFEFANKLAYGLVFEFGADAFQPFMAERARRHFFPKGQPCTATIADSPS